MELVEAMRTTGTCRYYHRRAGAGRRPVQGVRLGSVRATGRQPPAGPLDRRARPAKKKRLAELYLPYWEGYYNAITEGGVDVEALPETVRSADHFARHMAEHPALVVACGEVAGLHVTDADLDRVSVVGGGSIYPTVQNFCLALRDQGVGSAVTTLLCHEEPKVRELLNIPDGFLTAAHVAVGYPAKGFPKKLTRTPVEEIVGLDDFATPMFR
jgi:nitroreductase